MDRTPRFGYYPAMSRPEVLLVSAHEGKAEDVVRTLRDAGYHTVICRDPTHLREALAEHHEDMMLLDLDLSGLDRAVLAEAFTSRQSGSPPLSLEDVVRRHVISVLHFTQGNKRRAAQILGIARSTLIQKVRRLGVEDAGR